jgi:hypothetical protein
MASRGWSGYRRTNTKDRNILSISVSKELNILFFKVYSVI